MGFSSKPNSLPDMIALLRNASALFRAAWSAGDEDQAARASQQAMKAFDHICNVFLRTRDDARGHIPAADLFRYMQRDFGLLVSPVTRAEQQQNSSHPANHGNGRLPGRSEPYKPAKLHAAFNKIKHRNDQYSNFRIEKDRHILTVAGDRSGKPDYVFEFDVVEFCDVCDQGRHLI